MAHIVVFTRLPLLQQWLCSALTGHIVTVVESANAAARMVRQPEVPVDLVIAEWLEDDAVRMIEEIQRFYNFTPPPIVLTADIRSPEGVEKATLGAISKGAKWFIPRPMSRKAFRTEVEAVISEFGSEDDYDCAVTAEVTEIIPPPRTAPGLCAMLVEVYDVRMMVEQTTGWNYLEEMITAAVETEGLDAAQQCCARMLECACGDLPRMHAATWSQQYGNRLRMPSEELLFRIAHGILFTPRLAA